MGAKHPALDHGIDKSKTAQYEQAVVHAMTMDETEWLGFVPEYGFVSYCECPNCYGGAQGLGVFGWAVEDPEKLTCRYCGEVVHPSDEYEEDQELVGENSLGEEVRLPYYLNEERGVTHFFSMYLQLPRRQWLLGQCIALGEAYQATGLETYARRVVLILDRCAQVYPHYPALHNRSSRDVRFCECQHPPFSWDAGRWGYFHNEIPKQIIAAYDMVWESPELERLSAERGYDVRQKLTDDFLRKTYEVAAASDYHVGNVVGYDVAGVAMLGRVIEEPRYVHEAFRWMVQNLDEGFFVDGHWHESPSYHYMTVGGLQRAFGTVAGYTDPPGYVDEVDGTRLDDLDPEQAQSFWAKVHHSTEALDFPNGCSTPVHDTWAGEVRSRPRSTTVSTIAPGYGQASLGRGTGENQMQAQLHFSGTYGHHHFDNLNLTVFAKGSEMVSDLGYTWTQMRSWCNSTLCHNTVVVDRVDQTGGETDGDLLRFFPDTHGISVVEADGSRGYHNIDGLNLYQRLLVMVPVGESDAYVVDIFRVRGGTIHDWALHGDANEDTTARCSLPLDDARKWMLEPDEDWEEPTHKRAKFHPYGMFRDASRAQVDGVAAVDYVYDADPERGIRVHLGAYPQLSGETNSPVELWLGRSPSVRRMGRGAEGDMRKLYDFWMPHLVGRREGVSPLSSTFVAVEEPFAGEPFIQGVDLLPLEPDDGGAVALRIRHTAGTDMVISTLDEPPYPKRVAPDGVEMRGRLGVLREPTEGPTRGWLFEGVELASVGCRLGTERGRHEGRIVGAMREADGDEQDAFIVEGDLPEGESLKGIWMVVTHGNGFTHGYEIDRVERRDGNTVAVLADDHGLRIDGDTTKEAYFPRREILGQNTFVIPLSATVDAGD